MSSDSKMHNGIKGRRRSLPRFWVRPYHNLKWWNDFMETWLLKNGKKTLECWNVYFNNNSATATFLTTIYNFFELCSDLFKFGNYLLFCYDCFNNIIIRILFWITIFRIILSYSFSYSIIFILFGFQFKSLVIFFNFQVLRGFH